MNDPIRILNGKFELIRPIADGGFARVFEAKRPDQPDISLAIKIAKVDYKETQAYQASMLREANIIFDLGTPGHKSVVKLLPFADSNSKKSRPHRYARALELEGGPYFFVMEYLAGGTLDEYIELVEKVTVEEAASIGTEIARAISYIHRSGFYHNDLKLENVVFREPVKLDEPFEPVVIDFGIAAKETIDRGTGSLYIMSPERLEASRKTSKFEVDLDLEKVDVWGLGVVLYRMLAGQLPFAASGSKRLTEMIRKEMPELISKISEIKIPSELEKLVIHGCLEKNPQNRISIVELGKELAQFGVDVTAKTVPGNRWSKALFTGP